MKIAIVGAGGHARVIADAIKKKKKDTIIGFFDDNTLLHGKFLNEIKVIDKIANLQKFVSKNDHLIIAIGDNQKRREYFELFKQKGYSFTIVIHPSAVVSSSATIQEGTVIFAGAIINPNAVIGSNVIINTGAIIEHDNKIHNHSHVAPGASLGGNVIVGENTLVGIGANVNKGVSIGKNCVIASGCSIYKDIPDNSIVRLPDIPKIRVLGKND